MSLKLKPKNKNNKFDTVELIPSADNYGKPSKKASTKRALPSFTEEKNMETAINMGNKNGATSTNANGSTTFDNELDKARSSHSDLDDLDDDLEDEHGHSPKKFGTFDGVLARCLLCIWGVIMYLRTGWIVGNAGIWQTTIIMILASSVTFLTSLSLSAICTNGEVKSGGYYFLISRSLGPEFGGVIGILFAFANCISVAMYLAGFSETIVAQYSPPLTGSDKWDIVIWAEITLCLILCMALRGVSGIIKFDMVLLVVLIISIIIYFLGTFGVTKIDIEGIGFTGYSSQTFSENWNAAYMPNENFISVFSVFFPAVTGEMAGANISGDLRDPSYAIPHGTLSAIIISTIVYIGIAWSLGGSVLRFVGDSKSKGLYYDNQIMPKISAWSPLVLIGIFASTLSSGMSCFVGAPRIFQAVCQDNLFPSLSYFAKGRDGDGEPVRAYCIVFVICFLAILTGDINFIAPIITNFFLITYAVMNYSTFTWSLTRSPGWRPTFRWYNKWVSLFASSECIGLMFLIDWLMALITVVIGLIMYKYVAYTEPNVHWGTAAEAITYVETCNKLLKYQTIKSHAKVERPKFLIFNRTPQHVKQMYEFAHIMNEKFRGMTMIGDVIIGSPKDHAITNKYVKRARNHQWTDIPVDIIKNSLVQTCIAPTFVDGVRTILQTAGVGAIKPNVLLINVLDWSTTCIQLKGSQQTNETIKYAPEAPDYIDGLQDALLTGMGVLLVAANSYMDWTKKMHGFIDIWWLYDDGGLTVLIPYLLSSHELWKDCKLRIMALENLGYSEQNELASLMTKLRINAEIVPVRSDENYDAFGGKIQLKTTDNNNKTPTETASQNLPNPNQDSNSTSPPRFFDDKTARDDQD
eukprot:310752_1